MSAIQKIPREIALLTQARAWLAECQNLDEIKTFRDQAEALRLYYQKRKECDQAWIMAGEMKCRADRRIGEVSKLIETSPGGRPKKTKTGSPGSPVSKKSVLAEAGIDKKTAQRCEAIADCPKEEFEKTIEKAKKAGEAPTCKALSRKGQTHKRTTQKRADLNVKAKKAKASSNGEPTTWEIRQGDCVEILNSIEPATVRLVFADPPYNIGVKYGDHCDDSLPADEYEEWCRGWMSAIGSVLTWDGSFLLLIGLEWAPFLCTLAVDLGFHYRQWITWYETFGVNCDAETVRKYNRTSRALIWFTRHPETFAWNPEVVNRPSDRQTKYNDTRANPKGKTWDDVWGINPPIPRLVGTADERQPDFPTQLPIALLPRSSALTPILETS